MTGSQGTGPQPALEGTPAVPTMTAAAPATAATDEPAAAIENLRDNDRPLTGQDLIDEDFPQSWPLFGSDYRMAFGGYVKLDYLQDSDGTGDRLPFVTGTIPVDGPEAGVGGYMNAFARETRFSFEVRKTTPGAPPQKYFVEMDFFQESAGAFNQFPRLRHAYFVYGNFLAGRTWGILTDTRAFPTLIDFAAGDALSGTRAAQVWWEQRISGGLNRWRRRPSVASPSPSAPTTLPLHLPRPRRRSNARADDPLAVRLGGGLGLRQRHGALWLGRVGQVLSRHRP